MSDFIRRHIGASDAQVKKMLTDLSLETLDDLVNEVVPESILSTSLDELPLGCMRSQH